MRAAIALGVLLAAAPAYAGWQRTTYVDANGQTTALPAMLLRAVGGARPAAGQPARVWAVGGNATSASFIVASADGFRSASAVPDCSAIAVALNALWVAPDASYVHAFGRNASHAAWDGTGWTCTPFAPPPGWINVNVASAAFESPTSGYLGGNAVMGGNFVGRWTGAFANATPTGLLGSVVGMARATPSNRWFFTSAASIYRLGLAAPIATGPGAYNALAFHGDLGIAVAGLAAGTRLIDGATDTVAPPSGVAIDFEPIHGVALSAGGFAVAVGAVGSTAAGGLAQSYDGGQNWRRIDLGALGGVHVLYGVSCWDENSCAAVGGAPDGAGGYDPELLFYENGAPSVDVTANGQALSAAIPDDATICLAATVTDPEGDPVSWTWHGGTIEGDSGASAPCFSAPVGCGTQSVTTYSIAATDGRRGTTKPLALTIVHVPRPPSAPVLSPAPPTGTFAWRAGESHAVTASSTLDCSRPVSFEFQGQGVLPAPAVQGDVATFDLSGLGCAGGTGSILVRAIDSDASVAPVERQYPVVVSDWVVAPTIDAPLAGSTVRVAPEGTAQVTAQVRHCSGSLPGDFTYRWSCDAAQTGPTLTLSNPSADCERRFACDLEVTPVLAGQPSATVRFDVVLEASAAPAALTLGLAPATASLAAGEQVSVVATPAGLCEPALAWTCTGTNPPQPGSATSWVFANPADQCAEGAYVACLVTATSRDGTETADATFRVELEPQPQALSASFSVTPAQPAGPIEVPPGGSATATVAATSACPATYSWTWACSGAATAPPPGATLVTFLNAEATCERREGRCLATAQADDGSSDSVAIDVVFLPQLNPPLDLTVALAPFDGVEVRGTASTPPGDCIAPGDFEWSAWLRSAPETVIARGTGPDIVVRPQACGKDTLEVRVLERNSGLVETAEVQLAGPQGPPVIAEPTSDDYLPSDEPVLDCSAPAPVVLRPRVTASCDPAYAWRQLSGPAVVALTRADGSLEIRPPAGSLAGMLGRSATFELTVDSRSGRSEPRSFEVTFLPDRFVRLSHAADRASAAVGEPVRFTVQISSRCSAAFEAGADLHLDLQGLEYVRGSARLEGVGLQEPEVSAGELVFRGVTVPAAGEAPRQLKYVARRRAATTGTAASRAVAYLTASPTMLISEEANARQGSRLGVPAMSCQCTEAGGGLGAWLALASLVGLGARRRPRRSC